MYNLPTGYYMGDNDLISSTPTLEELKIERYSKPIWTDEERTKYHAPKSKVKLATELCQKLGRNSTDDARVISRGRTRFLAYLKPSEINYLIKKYRSLL